MSDAPEPTTFRYSAVPESIEQHYPISYVKELISASKEAGLSSLKLEGLELCFGNKDKDLSVFPKVSQGPRLKDEVVAVPEPPNMPPDLRGDDLFNYDKVLHWSGSGEPEPMPLTGEEGL